MILWITLFTHFSTDKFETACSAGCGFILLNSLANQYTSHISHLYKISLQSAVVLSLNGSRRQIKQATEAIEMLTKLPSLHKFLYSLQYKTNAVLLYTMLLLYVLPAILLFTDQQHGTSDEKHIYWSISFTIFLLQILGNLKAVLLSVFSHIAVLSIFVTIIFCVLLLLLLPPLFFHL